MLTKEDRFKLNINLKFPEANKYAFTFISLLIILLAVYSNSFQGEWHFDDFANIVNNPHVQIKSFSWDEIKNCIYGLEQKRPSRPLSYFSFALNYYADGENVFGYHLVNFTIHYLAAVFLFLFIYNTLHLPLLREKYSPIAYPTALLATFFWALNPVQVTSVTYIVQRMASMAGLFYIMSMYFYLKFRAHDKPIYLIIYLALCIFTGIAAVLSKENAVMLPVSILLFDLILIQGFNKENIKKFLKIILLPAVIIFVLGFIFTDFSSVLGGYENRDFTMMQRLLTEPRVIIFYLSLLFYPINSRLTLLYDIDVSRSLLQPWTTIPAILLIAAIIGLAFYIAKKRPLISFCIIFYFLNHLIEGSIFSLELIYEHRNYLPSMLLFVPLAEFIIYAIDYFSYKKIIQFIVAFGIVIILIGEGDVTYQRNKILSDDYLLWFDNIDKSPLLSRTHSNLGRIYYNYGEKEKAFQEYEKAMHLNKFGGRVTQSIQEYNLGLYYFEEMKNDLALNYFEKSLQMLPDYIPNTIGIANIKLRQNRSREAKRTIENKLIEYPENLGLLESYCLILLKEGKVNESYRLAKYILSRNPESIFPLMIMAEICRIKNNYSGAISHWKSVQLLSPKNAYANLALIELYTKINNSKMLDQEISLLFQLMGNLKLDEYIKASTKDKNLIIYVPKADNYSKILKKYCEIN